METKLSIVIMSHLSDVQEQLSGRDNYLSCSEKDMATTRINFVKWLLMRHRNIDIEIDPEKEFEHFTNLNNYSK